MCNALKFPRSTYYKALISEPSNKQIEYEKFSQTVILKFNECKQRYGAVKLQRALVDEGIKCSVKRVQRHMVRNGLRSVVVRKYKHHSSKNEIPEKDNILNRNFETDTINQKWCTDITYIHVLKEGWTYLASVMDLHTRKIIGYAYGTEIMAELAKKAVENSCLNVSDTEGIDLIVVRNGRFHPIFLQVKGRYTLHQGRSLILSVKVKTFTPHANYYVIGAYFDPTTLEVDSNLLFIPSKELVKNAVKASSKNGEWYRVVSSIGDKSSGKWTEYLIKKEDLATRLIEKFEEMDKYIK